MEDMAETNRDRISQILQHIADHVISLIDSDLKFESYEQINRKAWIDATTALRSIREAMMLLADIAYMDQDIDLSKLPALDLHAIYAYSTTLGNRCYWQRSTIAEWLKGSSSTHTDTGIADYRFDLDFDVVETETTETTETKTETTKTTKTTKRRKKSGDDKKL